MKQHFASAGNLGISLIATASAVGFITTERLSWGTNIFLAVLLVLFGLDLYFSYFFKYAPIGNLPGKVHNGRWKPSAERSKNADRHDTKNGREQDSRMDG